MQNTCTCADGDTDWNAATHTVAATGVDCLTDNGTICVADANCAGETDGDGDWPGAADEADSSLTCPTGQNGTWTRACNNAVLAAAETTCSQNTCTCADGDTDWDAATHTTAATGADCLTDNGTICVADPVDQCTCVNGTGSAGADCATDDSADCATCEAGFEIVGGATAEAGDACVATVCTCDNGTAAVDAVCLASGVHCTACTARVEWEAEVLPVAAAAEDDAETLDIDETVEIEAAAEVPGVAGFNLVVVDENDATEEIEWSSTCAADVCVCSDPAVVNADNDGGDADGIQVANTGTEEAPVWANWWAAGNQTPATGWRCPSNGADACQADPTMCTAEHACGAADGWTIKTDLSVACTAAECTNEECCTEDDSADPVVESDEPEFECTCGDDVDDADVCADAATDDDCTAAGGEWTEVEAAEDEEDEEASAAVASAVVALISLLL